MGAIGIMCFAIKWQISLAQACDCLQRLPCWQWYVGVTTTPLDSLWMDKTVVTTVTSAAGHLSEWSLHVSHRDCVELLWIFWFLPTFQRHAVRWTGDSKLPTGVIVNGCLFMCQPCDRLGPVQGVPRLSLNDSKASSSTTLKRTSG